MNDHKTNITQRNRANDFPKYKKADFFLLAMILIIAAAIFILYHHDDAGKSDGGLHVEVRVAGKRILSLPLHTDCEKEIVNDFGTNRLVIRDGKARIIEADCPDKLCVYQKAIARPGETLICLPHQLVVEVVGDAPPDLDSISN
ncbi:MAG: NusG domain II-containing protein [Eubacteriales bacterium]|nr:NusG domain II-containing protein [Eubacteriales bacterium]